MFEADNQILTNSQQYKIINSYYPHIGNKLSLLWGYTEFNNYIATLFLDDRDGKRSGFPYEHMRALLTIAETHKRMFPNLLTTDIWDQ